MSGLDDTEDQASVFTRLWTKHQNSVFAYIRTLMPNWTDAEDVLQETGAVLWKKYEQFDPQTDFRRWACGVAYYEVLKQRERLARKSHFSDAFLAMMAKRAVVMVDEVPSLHEGLASCIDKLSESDRYLLILRYASAMAISAIAAQLQRSSDAVRKSLRRLHRSLFDCVERWQRREEHT
jgi:RNA polymerase sigma-70 factor, ECF subfamily